MEKPKWLKIHRSITGSFDRDKALDKEDDSQFRPWFCPGKDFVPKYKNTLDPNVIVIYPRSAKGGRLREIKPGQPPRNTKEAISGNHSNGKPIFKWLEQNMINHNKSLPYLDLDGQINFNKRDIAYITKLQLNSKHFIKNAFSLLEDESLQKNLYANNKDLYEDSLGNFRLHNSIDKKNNQYYFDLPKPYPRGAV